MRRRLPAGPPAGAGGHHPRRHRGGPAPEGVGPRRGGHHRPHGLGRDLKRFAALGYVAQRAEAVDLFPRTAHIETVVALARA